MQYSANFAPAVEQILVPFFRGIIFSRWHFFVDRGIITSETLRSFVYSERLSYEIINLACYLVPIPHLQTRSVVVPALQSLLWLLVWC